MFLLNEITNEIDNVRKRFLYELNQDLGFYKPIKFSFYTNGIKDQDPVKWVKTEYGYSGKVKTLGLEKARVKLNEDSIEVSGKNIIDDEGFGMLIKLPVDKNILSKIKEIKHKTVAGITLIELHVDKPEQRIKITEIE